MFRILLPLYILHWKIYHFYAGKEGDFSAFWSSIIASLTLLILNITSILIVLQAYGIGFETAPGPYEQRPYYEYIIPVFGVISVIWLVMYAGRNREEIFEELEENFGKSSLVTWLVRGYVFFSILVLFMSIAFSGPPPS